MAKIEPACNNCSDPVVTANVYCKGHLDAVLLDALKPFQLSSQPWQLWIMRYRRGGEHIKIRLHGTAAEATQVKARLEEHLRPVLSNIRWPEAGNPPKLTGANDPVIDEEDSTPSDHPPGHLVWTHYKRSHVTFGGEPYLSDDRYVALFGKCLSASLEYFLSATELVNGVIPHAQRLAEAAELVGSALQFLELNSPEYLNYHRDWLVRFVLLKTSHTPQEHQDVLKAFDKRVTESERFWEHVRDRSIWAFARPGAVLNKWQSAITELMKYVNDLCQRQQFQIDPYALHPSHSALFKVLHGASNQAGLALLDEALMYHGLSVMQPQAHALVG